MKPPLSQVPLLGVTASFAIGILLDITGLSPIFTTLPLLAAIICACKGWSYTALLCTTLSLSMLIAFLKKDDSTTQSIAGREQFYIADVIDARESESALLLTADIIATGLDTVTHIAPTRCLLSLPSFSPATDRGDRIVARFTPENPQSLTYLPYEIDFSKELKRKGIKLQGVVRPEDVVSVNKSPALMPKIAALRTKISRLILSSQLSDDTKEFLVTTIAGDSSILTQEQRETLTKAGLAHVLALSGLHIGILAGVCSLFLLPLRLFKYGRYVALCFTIMLIWSFVLITGMSPSVVRAAIMSTIMLLATLMQRHHSPFNALCAAALLIMIFDPDAIFTISFQLSFAAVAGVLAFAQNLNPVPPRRQVLHYIASLFTVSIGAMTATGLLSMFYFHRFPLLFIISNALVCPLLMPLIGGGAVLIAVRACGFDGIWLCKGLDLIHSIIAKSAAITGSLQGAEISGIIIPVPAIFVGMAAIISLMIWYTRRRKAFLIASFITFGACIAIITLTDRDTEPEAFIAPSTYRTDIVISEGSKVTVITTAKPAEYGIVQEQAQVKYREYLVHRGTDSLSVSTHYSGNSIQLIPPLLKAGDKRIWIVNNNTVRPPMPSVDYLLVCRGYQGSISQLTSLCHTDTVILSADLHPWRHNRYATECASIALPHISLKTTSIGNLLMR